MDNSNVNPLISPPSTTNAMVNDAGKTESTKTEITTGMLK